MSEFKPPLFRGRVHRRPLVWWHVHGRKVFDNSVPTVIRKSWKVGSYPLCNARGKLCATT